MRPTWARITRHVGAFCLVLGLLLAHAPTITHAEDDQTEGQKKKRKRRAKAKKRRDKERKVESSQATKKGDKERGGRSEAARRAREAASGTDTEIIKEGDTNVKVMRFGGLSLEGRLKSPQLLYFVNRVHAEFERPKLPHRSFMPELERSTHEDPL